MDIVITYVNGIDLFWQKDYEKVSDTPIQSKRFRDWGTLKYLLRGIEVNMPFIENVFLVVARESQIPEWVNRTTLKIILHKDIIPQQYLPTFNSTTIEMFLHKIEGLSEQYLYFNDDIFPLMPCVPEDFYIEGKTAMGFSTCLFANGLYRRQIRNGVRLARQALGQKRGVLFTRPQHTCSPMQKSVCAELYDKVEKQILETLSPLREMKNMNQHLFLNYMYYSGRAVARRIPGKFFSMAVASPSVIAEFVRVPKAKMMCINDVHLSEAKFRQYRESILTAFESRLPEKSKFEL